MKMAQAMAAAIVRILSEDDTWRRLRAGALAWSARFRWDAVTDEVEAVIGRVDANGHLEDTEVLVLPSVERQGPVVEFGKEIVPERTGRLGYALRVSPNHFDDPMTRPCTSLLKWSDVS
jgi:hypothetical protein